MMLRSLLRLGRPTASCTYCPATRAAFVTATAPALAKSLPPRPKPPPESEIEEFYLKGSGPGGQKIVIRFPPPVVYIHRTSHLTAPYRTRQIRLSSSDIFPPVSSSSHRPRGRATRIGKKHVNCWQRRLMSLSMATRAALP